ncbi:FxSxx-COOH system tetratricopeptide repeat protein [Streptomyces sp. NPDC051642]|uniref:FxSxx-COOH system tetratricopeptide repeat protein n=1 Tax=Streptomyces sp. NPDC051642 TaxID=3154646 RepID=UPI00342BC746
MTDSSGPIFVSHAGRDSQWAEWVAWHLQENGYKVELDIWHWRPGEDFVKKMSEALEKASAVVALFSPQYFGPGRYTEEEWTSAIAGRDRFLPLVVEPLEPGQLPAILRPRLRQDLHDLDEAEALKALLDAVRGPLPRTTPPTFPGAKSASSRITAPHSLRPRFPSTAQDPAVWDVRQRRNPHFTGRDEIIEKVRTGLLRERRAAVRVLHGPGGVGKTQVALEYAHRFAGQYDLVWWVDAEQGEQVPARYAELAARVDVAKPEAGAEINARYALEYLRTHDRWLIVLDNAEDPKQLRNWLPDGPGHVLITARDPAWSKVVPGLALGVFSRAESLAYLNGQLPTLSSETADVLADALGDLPLALAQAAGALEEGTPPDHYLQLLRTNTAQLLADGEVYDYPLSVAATVTIAADRLDTDHPEAAAVLRLAAFLGPEPIPTTWLVEAREALTSVPGGRHAISWPRNALQPLAQYGLAVVGPDAFQVHRLTQAVVRDRAGGQAVGPVQDDVAGLFAVVDPGDPDLPKDWPGWALLIPHLTAALDTLVGRAELRPTLLKAAVYLARSAQSEAALGLSEILYGTWTTSLGEDHTDTLHAAQLVGLALHGLEAFEEAVSLDADLLERRRRVLGEDHPDTLSTAHDLAVALGQLGRSSTAYAMLADIVPRREATLGENHLDALRSAASLGFTLAQINRLDEAHGTLTNVLERFRRTSNEAHPDALHLTRVLGLTLHRMHRFDEARVVLTDLLALSQQVVGNRHTHTLQTADALGTTLVALGQNSEAEQLLRTARSRTREAYGVDNLLYTDLTRALADALAGQGKTYDAQQLRASLKHKRSPKKRRR